MKGKVAERKKERDRVRGKRESCACWFTLQRITNDQSCNSIQFSHVTGTGPSSMIIF